MRRIVFLVVALVGLVGTPGVVSAHTDLEFTLPTDGASVGVPLDEITIGFTEPVTLVGNGFRVLSPQGEELLPFPITDDDRVFRLVFDPPLAGGQVGVVYEVAAADGHVLSGGFSFTIDAAVPTTTTGTTTVPLDSTPPTAATVAATIAPEPVTTVGAATTSSTLVVATSSTDETGGTTTESGSGGRDGLVIGAAIAVALGAAAFLAFRRNPS